jgi:hypothetical protein
MQEAWVKGIIFWQVFDYVRKNRGETTYQLLGRAREDFQAEGKYSFEDFAALLSRVKMMASNDDDYISRMARETMADEPAWKNLFRRMDPANVLASTQRQDGRHRLADYEPLEVSRGKVVLRMRMWSRNREHQDLWAAFYKGRLEGILELMGRQGSVSLVREFGDAGHTFTIRWASNT